MPETFDIMKKRTGKSEYLFERACHVLVGGVNSPVRAFKAVGGKPPVISQGKGAYVKDVDSNSYIDYVCSYGPAILGHCSAPVVTAINKAAVRGGCFGATCEAEVHLAEAIISAVKSIQKVRFVSSGTEAAMSAIRLARGATGREKIIKCVGCYHGHSDSLLVAAGSGASTLGTPSSAGVTKAAAEDTILVNYNDSQAVADAFEQFSGKIAAVLVEPIAANMGVVAPEEGYLKKLRELCNANSSLLIFDEVITGFRVGYAGAQGLYEVDPDITILGKIIGGGLPVGAFGGSVELMDHLSPIGSVYQAGTLSGNPITMAAGLATLQELQQEGFYEHLEKLSTLLAVGLRSAAIDAGIGGKICVNRVGSLLSCFFTPGPVLHYEDVETCNTEAFAAWFNVMLDNGVYLAPSQYEAMFVSAAHDEKIIDDTISVAHEAFDVAAKFI